ncbi:glycoside hydrolase family 28 protein [Actomonas aquatica]|uniref:Glycosyl hydrolase family 28 protein n=1 Tax=Actomonas aquatica TaxID=2866162 RepID=A0ABZ1CCF6_9BACT|nr:glycosyl hydrolase family 28 protein [Opitutus sp. WL0086]WRQ88284.1 glycosyl hydrolase family 28 protein [Opitutus sp. WL0086]
MTAPLLAADFVITDHGAIADGTTLNTSAIQATIDAAHDAGGGRVVIPAGTFRSGAIFLKQDVELHVAAGAILLGSDDLADYPKRTTRIEGHFPEWRVALVNASQIDGLKLSGEGEINGNGRVFWEAFWARRKENPQCTNLEVERPRLFFIDRCTNVDIRGLTLRDSGFWNIHLYNCQKVLVENVSIHAPGPGAPVRAPSSDGIDIDSCQDVVVRGCFIAVDDDCIALKGTKGPLADQDETSPPVERILVENCTFQDGHGVLTCGSEATLIRDVVIRDSKVIGDINLVRLKLRPDTPQHYSNILFENIEVQGGGRLFDVNPWLQFFDLKGHPKPSRQVDGIVLRNFTGHYGSPGRIVTNEGDTIAPIVLDNVNLTFDKSDFKLGDNVTIEATRSTFNGEPVN